MTAINDAANKQTPSSPSPFHPISIPGASLTTHWQSLSRENSLLSAVRDHLERNNMLRIHHLTILHSMYKRVPHIFTTRGVPYPRSAPLYSQERKRAFQQRRNRARSTDRTPGHGDHDAGFHFLDERDGTVDGFGPAIGGGLSVICSESNCEGGKEGEREHTQKRPSSAHAWPCAPPDRGTARGGGLRLGRRFGRTLRFTS